VNSLFRIVCTQTGSLLINVIFVDYQTNGNVIKDDYTFMRELLNESGLCAQLKLQFVAISIFNYVYVHVHIL